MIDVKLLSKEKNGSTYIGGAGGVGFVGKKADAFKVSILPCEG